MSLSYTQISKQITTVHAGKIRIGDIQEKSIVEFHAQFFEKGQKVICTSYEEAKKFIQEQFEEYGIQKFSH